MIKLRACWLGVALLAFVFGSGCGRPKNDEKEKSEHKSGDGHDDDKEKKGGKEEEHEGGGGGVAFKEGRGLRLSPEIVKALSLTTVEAAERPLSAELNIVAQVFTLKPEIKASASMPAAAAQRLQKETFRGAKIAHVDLAGNAATRLADVVFVLDPTTTTQLGDFVHITLESEPKNVIAIPQTAVLDGAGGTFVYVVNGEFYLRSPVKTGARAKDYVEITDGLYAGDAVVVSPVNQLWLAELRLTKGGGHSH